MSYKKILKGIYIIIVIIADIIFSPITLLSALWLKLIRKHNIGFWKTNSILSKRIFEFVGVFPIIEHYYEPLVNVSKLKKSLREDRNLPGIDINTEEQLSLLQRFNFNEEILEIANLPTGRNVFSFKKGPFPAGDAETLYNMIRHIKPVKIIEIGCGHSTLMMQHAIEANKKEQHSYQCNHVCIEPFENAWLSELNVNVVRDRVENLDLSLFKALNENDILFIDSTHMIRPQGDVLFEFLEVLPILNKGVIVHIHDIFTPKDYLDEWVKDGVVFWNEQYLLEAFLSGNKSFKIISASNYLKHNHYEKLKATCSMLKPDSEPGSFWIQKIA